MTSQTTEDIRLKCVEDGESLVESRTSGEPSMRCPKCEGAWITTEALHAIEDKSFDDEMVKGQMRYGEHEIAHNCPHCGDQMTRFRYRGYNLELEACPNDAGYWLDHGEDRHIQDVMKERTRRLQRSSGAEQDWRRARRGESPSLIQKILNVFRR